MPQTFGDLLKVKTRWTYGKLELSSLRPDLDGQDKHKHEGGGRSDISSGALALAKRAGVVFVFVYASSRRESASRKSNQRGSATRAHDLHTADPAGRRRSRRLEPG